jgi:hypothetical protein
MTYDAYVSVDLGRQHDYTAILVAEEARWIGEPPAYGGWASQADLAALAHWPADTRGWVPPSTLAPSQRTFFRERNYLGDRPDRPPLLVRHVERVRNVPYPQVVTEVAALLARPPLSGLAVALLVDAGGVGVAVLDFMRQRGLRPYSVTATGGDSVNGSRGEYRVPKRELVAAAQIALAEGRLRIAAGLEHAATLTRELQGYQVRISAAGHDSYAAREGEHDDLVYAAAQLCWFRDWYLSDCDDAVAARRRSPAEVG